MPENEQEVCPICGGLGAVVADVPVGDPNFGKAFPCVCQADKIKARRRNGPVRPAGRVAMVGA